MTFENRKQENLMSLCTQAQNHLIKPEPRVKLAKSHSLLVPLFHQKVVIGQGPIAKGGPKEFKQMFYRGRNLLYIYGIG